MFGSRCQDACHGSTQELPIEPGRSFRCDLFARCAGIHVDFHAHRHFDNFRSLPGHSILPRVFARVFARVFGANSTPRLKLGPRPAPRKCGRSSVEHRRARPDSRYFSAGQSDFPLGQGFAASGKTTTRAVLAARYFNGPRGDSSLSMININVLWCNSAVRNRQKPRQSRANISLSRWIGAGAPTCEGGAA